MASLENQFKVRLSETKNYSLSTASNATKGNLDQKKPLQYTGIVTFDVSPDITETRSVEYKTMQPVHMPGQILAYGSSTSRTYSVSNIKLISRTHTEASLNMQRLWTLRGWTMPRFGTESSTINHDQDTVRRQFEQKTGDWTDPTKPPSRQKIGKESLGQPPQVVYLNAYSNLSESQKMQSLRREIPTNIHNVPVVLQSLSIPYQSDVDYIPTHDGQPFPRVMVLDLQLVEARAPRELSEQFSLDDYKNGLLGGF